MTRSRCAVLMKALCSSRCPQYGQVSSSSSGSALYSAWRILNGASHDGHSRPKKPSSSSGMAIEVSKPSSVGSMSPTPSGLGRCSQLIGEVKHSPETVPERRLLISAQDDSSRAGVAGRAVHYSLDEPLGHACVQDTSEDSGHGHKEAPQTRGFSKRLMGLEPTTYCMASSRSSQLSYSRVLRRL